jgi:hypothetical protein
MLYGGSEMTERTDWLRSTWDWVEEVGMMLEMVALEERLGVAVVLGRVLLLMGV